MKNAVIVGVLIFIVMACSELNNKSGTLHRLSSTPTVDSPTRAIRTPVAIEPTITPTTTPTDEPVKSLRESRLAPTPGATAVDIAASVQWIQRRRGTTFYRVPLGWWDDSGNQEITASHADGFVSVEWFDTDYDTAMLFYANNEHSTHVQSIVNKFEEAIIAKLNEEVGTVDIASRLPQDALGERLVVGAVAHEFSVSGTWSDASVINMAMVTAECGKRRLCAFQLEKVDAPVTANDWQILAYFANHIVFQDKN